MKEKMIFTPWFAQIDSMFMGSVIMNALEKQTDYLELDTEEEFDVERSSN